MEIGKVQAGRCRIAETQGVYLYIPPKKSPLGLGYFQKIIRDVIRQLPVPL